MAINPFTGEKINTAKEQFVEDFLLVADNDYEFYTSLKESADNTDSVATLSDELREEYETLAEQICELVDKEISDTAGLLMRQMLQGWGSMPFDDIARELLSRKDKN
mgnify:CR=1 FL=1